MTKLHQLADLGQAVWFDYIRRSFITSGEFQALIDDGVRGVTSNPSILEKAIAGSADYDEEIRALVASGESVVQIYEVLVLEDIRRAADLLRPLYDETGGLDGYVSLEVSPALAHDTAGTIADARRLFESLDRPTVMIKVPATPAGIPAIEALIGAGINTNATLMFSMDHYDAVAGAYIAGLEKLAANGCHASQVASVASFFVSRVDTVVDQALKAIGTPEARALLGTIAIANSKMAYARFQQTFSGPRWEQLSTLSARAQRPLWASTSTKDPLYTDTMYVEELIGPDTVNTIPPHTLDAFREHGTVAQTLEQDWRQARDRLVRLSRLGVDLDAITEKLQADGVAAFARSFESLLASIAAKRGQGG